MRRLAIAGMIFLLIAAGGGAGFRAGVRRGWLQWPGGGSALRIAILGLGMLLNPTAVYATRAAIMLEQKVDEDAASPLKSDEQSG